MVRSLLTGGPHNVATISFVDSVGAASFGNQKPRPADKFGNWTPDVEVIGPTATGLGTGDLHVFEFRSDYIVNLEIAAIPATEYETMLRCKRHLERSGEVTLTDENLPPLIIERFTMCKLAPDTRPQISFSDRQQLEYTFQVVLKGAGIGEGTAPVPPDTTTDLAEGCGLLFWYKVDSLVLDDGDPVATWGDLSGNGHDATQSTVGKRPIYSLGEFGALPGLRFAGTYGDADFLALPDMGAGLTGAEIFIVLKTDADPPVNGWDAGLWRFATETGQRTLYPNNDDIIGDDFGSTIKTVGHPSIDLTQPHVYNVTSMDGEWSARHNGVLVYLTTLSTFDPAGFALSADPSIGTSSPSAQVFNFRGAIAEIFCYKCKLGDVARAGRNAYIAERYPMIEMG
jgi:hypothetical protein